MVKYAGATRECEQPHTCGASLCGRVSVCETAFGISFIMNADQAGRWHYYVYNDKRELTDWLDSRCPGVEAVCSDVTHYIKQQPEPLMWFDSHLESGLILNDTAHMSRGRSGSSQWTKYLDSSFIHTATEMSFSWWLDNLHVQLRHFILSYFMLTQLKRSSGCCLFRFIFSFFKTTLSLWDVKFAFSVECCISVHLCPTCTSGLIDKLLFNFQPYGRHESSA